jgi:omega-6 fatty acid desaturase (delta-12 desaturase)
MSNSADAFRLTRPYATAVYGSALWQLANTLALYACTIALMFWTVTTPGIPYVATLALSLVASVGYMRLFMIGHDTSHDSFMPKKWENVVVGNLMGVLTNTPVAYWGRQHHLHHQGNGNLDKRGNGDVQMMTVEEFRTASVGQRIWYRVYRNPFFLFFVAAPVHFVVLQRYPFGHQSKALSGWRSVLGTDLGILLYYGALIAAFGWSAFLQVYVPVVWLSAAGAVWLFYVQHQYEGTYFERQSGWRYQDAALEGSSFYNIGPFLHWCCANIGYHHIHHLNPKVPNYRLPTCHAETPDLREPAYVLSLRESISTATLALWDEDRQKLVSFKEAGVTLGEPLQMPPDSILTDREVGT